MAIAKKNRDFNPRTFYPQPFGTGRRMLLPFRKMATIFAQGGPSDGPFFIQQGAQQTRESGSATGGATC